MEACFFHTLSELDPAYSQHLGSRPRVHRATMTERLLKQLGITGEESEDMRLVSGSGRLSERVSEAVGDALSQLGLRILVRH